MDREALGDYPMDPYNVVVTITAFLPEREVAWSVAGEGRSSIGHVYGYTLEAVEGGTLVTSYYDWSAIGDNWRKLGVFPVISEGALRATLGILARKVAPGGVPAPG
jgi:hypothetical protein